MLQRPVQFLPKERDLFESVVKSFSSIFGFGASVFCTDTEQF
jgi:hypothetical protein